ncbi:O-antigen/teichoic acid export membrane protein [Plasticicumulans lactativorans]|uniref:O-antigen/teichoic acid export membrane protein n=1 Tax=Plasticicumulans lactativorans TaxID=1133106 RepID=A0A4V2SCS2_9GAMM|nr:lipopolysaccharide biosynthesis protein [Plasticicumulans lactativorans]TCO80450.1 O-antigen/teichoic acid export membrane protein [Plasticicumulans lactativorans]
MSEELRGKAVRAMGLLGVGGGLGKLITMGATLILARLLSPADYGLMAMASVVLGLIGFFNEVGIGAAIVQAQNLSREAVNGCFVMALVFSCMLFLLACAAAWPVAAFYDSPELRLILPVLALGFIVGGFNTVPSAFLRKELRFSVMVRFGLILAVVQAVLTVALAVAGFGVWSLVLGGLFGQVIYAMQLFRASPWRPSFAINIREGLSLVRYGLSVTYSRVLWYIYSNADKAIIGKLLGDHSLGIYDMANSLATLPTSQVTSIVTNVSSPVFAKLQDDMARLGSVMLKLTRGIAYFTFPALGGLFVVADDLVLTLLGDQWLDMLVPFRALCLLGLIRSVDPLMSQVLISTGNASRVVAYTGMCALIIPVAVGFGAWFDGMRGASVAWLLAYPLCSVKLLRDTCRLIGLPIFAYYRNLLPVFSGTALMVIAVECVQWGCAQFGMPVGLRLVAQIATGIVIYIGWMIYAYHEGLADLRQIMLDFGIAEEQLARWPFTRLDVT